ncbi:MAG: 1,4-beta-D-glucan glucohydrolase, partial [Pseudomonadota bacterium]
MTLRILNSRQSAVSTVALGLVLMSSACAIDPGMVRAVPVQAVTPQASIVTDATRAHPALWPRAASPAAMTDRATEAFVTELMSRMTLEEKVGQ